MVLYWQGKTEVLGQKPAPVPVIFPQTDTDSPLTAQRLQRRDNDAVFPLNPVFRHCSTFFRQSKIHSSHTHEINGNIILYNLIFSIYNYVQKFKSG